MGDNKSKFELVAFDKAQVASLVNANGAEVVKWKNKSLPSKIADKAGEFLVGAVATDGQKTVALIDEMLKLGLDSHEGRKEFLSKKLGIDTSTADNYRLITYRNDSGQEVYFRGHMDGDRKLVLTDSIAAPENADQVHRFFQSSFKSLPKPIEVQIEKSTVTRDGTKLEVLPDEKKKLETQAALAAVIHKSGEVQLTSNARLPGKPTAPGAGLTV